MMKQFYYLVLSALLSSQAFASYMPMEIINDSGFPDNQVYIISKGISLDSGKDCLLKFDEKGKGECVIVNDHTDAKQFSYPLSKLKAINIPKIASGRLYISVGYPMDLYITKGENKIIDSDGFKPRDSNYYTLHDKIEFSYTDAGTWINPTAVDFFSLPIKIEQEGSQSGITSAGLSGTRESIFSQLHQVVEDNDRTNDKVWKKLFLNINEDGNVIPLRFIAPGKAMIQNIPNTKPFDENYLNNEKAYAYNYVDAVWNYYKNNELLIDASELKNFFKLNDYLFTGKVNENNEFIFTNQDGSYKEVIAKPKHSTPFFAGAGQEFDHVNNTPKAIIVRQLSSAFEVGLLPAADGAVIDKSYFVEYNSSFFTDNDRLGNPKQGPWYDLYSKALHSFGHDQPIYAFAYDDALGQDGTLHDPNGDQISKVTVTLGGMGALKVPDPYTDSTLYNVKVLIGENSTVKYNGAPVKHLDTLSNVSVPFVVDVNGHQANIYIKHPMVHPYYDGADGIVIEKNGDKDVTIIFPGLPKKTTNDSNNEKDKRR